MFRFCLTPVALAILSLVVCCSAAQAYDGISHNSDGSTTTWTNNSDGTQTKITDHMQGESPATILIVHVDKFGKIIDATIYYHPAKKGIWRVRYEWKGASPVFVRIVTNEGDVDFTPRTPLHRPPDRPLRRTPGRTYSGDSEDPEPPTPGKRNWREGETHDRNEKYAPDNKPKSPPAPPKAQPTTGPDEKPAALPGKR